MTEVKDLRGLAEDLRRVSALTQLSKQGPVEPKPPYIEEGAPLPSRSFAARQTLPEYTAD